MSNKERHWEKSKGYWKDVREVWSEIMDDEEKFSLRKKVDGKPLYAHHLGQAEDPEVLKLPSEERKKLIINTLEKFLIK